jgi:NAD(P)-dependent dehydrogenase (short-subunit alcohol dehydrogenase family)
MSVSDESSEDVVTMTSSNATYPDLRGRTAIVTGAASGIGLSISRQLHQAGALVALWDVDRTALDRAVAEFDQATALQAVEVDVRRSDDVDAAAKATQDALGCPTILVNCAGIRQFHNPLETSEADWRQVLAINLDGPFYCSAAAARLMVQAGLGGAIINICSVASLAAWKQRSSYVTSKTGLLGLTRALAVDLGRHNIRVNAVGPGYILTPIHIDVEHDPEHQKSVRMAPISRWGRAEEVAEVVAFLASSASSFVSGALVPVDGGLMAGGPE